MTYRFRKKNVASAVIVLLNYLLIFCEGATENSTKNDEFQSDETVNVSISDENYVPDNSTLNSTYYYNSKENSNDDYEDFELPMFESETLKNLNFPHSLKSVQKAMKSITNNDCINDVNAVLNAISERQKWALELVDSFPKFPESILYGNYYQLGNFDECIGAKPTIKTNDSMHSITSQYCLVDIHFTKKFDVKTRKKRSLENAALKKNRGNYENNIIHWALCLPSSCKPADAEIFVREMLLSTIQHFEIQSIDVNERKCTSNPTKPITKEEIIYGSILGIFLIFTLLATVVHLWHLRKVRKSAVYNVDHLRDKQSSVLKETLICFSVINTTERFFHTKPNDLNLESICGVKFLSMLIIIAGHSLIFFVGGPVANKNFFNEASTRWEHAIFFNSPIIVDSFLLLSGFLMCRLLLIELDKRKGRINFLALYLARYIRLTPAYAVVLGLYTTVLYRMGSGPFWESKIGIEQFRCQKSYWLNLLYVNNYVGTDNLCMFQSWYLAVDFHLFIIAPFIIYPLWWKPKLGECMLLFSTLASIFTPYWITYTKKLDPTVMAYPPEVEDLATNFYFVNYYIKTHMRISSYCVGLLYAYLVHKIQSSTLKIKTFAIIIGWIFAIFCGIASMFSIIIFYDPNRDVNIFENALYASLHRVTWSLAIGWVLFVCITDNAGFINKFLSYKFFIPASRLTYCAYLANGLVEIYSAGVTRQPMYMSIFELSCKTCGHIVLTFALAFILCIFFESPIHGMEKILLKKFDVKKEKMRESVMSVGEL